ncbi:LysR family transcriptional regulator [Rhodobacter sp. 24-YEA-8]|uniref:helix-turn-helix domain-containing protein n=1 Tax=Rhodobacter sp. 24-YEA-8 TaxID=1884310 RepID=UPI001C0BD764|nr:LysR family transcriptional regulator [Rhodobacter sp. 24-YEA-8]
MKFGNHAMAARRIVLLLVFRDGGATRAFVANTKLCDCLSEKLIQNSYMSLTLKQLRYFVTAAETGQISHAAIEMNISQSAVTAAIQDLQAGLGSSFCRAARRGWC